MNILIMNGNPQGYDGRLNSYLNKLTGMLQSKGHMVKDMQLKDMEIKYCTGCFGCWLKTPGLCLIKDGTEEILRGFVQSDLVLMASPVIMGFTSALLKRAQDRLIPVLLPYIELINNEAHHPLRYKKGPLLSILLERETDTDEEDIDIIKTIYDRIAVNAHSKVVFTRFIDDPIEEVFDAINRA